MGFADVEERRLKPERGGEGCRSDGNSSTLTALENVARRITGTVESRGEAGGTE